jgi:nitric oxide reductase NorE protein
MIVFTVLFAVIAYYGTHHRDLFAAGQALLIKPLGLLNTCVLILGSLLVVLAVDAARASQHRKSGQLLAGAMTCGATFAAVKAIEYITALEHGKWIHTNAFWMLFFAITGAHLLHVFVGITVLGLARKATFAGLARPRDTELLVSATCYWHMVDLLWLVIFPLFYLVN